jgi:glycosyltransferase involved in cell wall biosynthesis
MRVSGKQRAAKREWPRPESVSGHSRPEAASDLTTQAPSPALVVVLPEPPTDPATHYAHYKRLLEELSSLTTVALVVEKGGAPELPGIETHALRRTNQAARAAELAAILVKLRRRGFRFAYGPYSRYFGVVGGLVGRIIGIRTAYWHCRSDFFGGGINEKRALSQYVLDSAPFVMSLHFSRRVITGTENLADLYTRTFRLPRGKVRVVPNDIDVKAFSPAMPGTEGDLTLLFVHRLGKHQGAALLPEIFKGVDALLPHVRMIVAGGGPEEQWLRAEFAEQIASGQVELLGYVPNSKVRSLMRAADLLLMPSLTEGFPRVLLEAMASGLPFVATHVGGVPEVVGEEARERLVAPGDARGFTDEVHALSRQPEARRRLAEEGLKRVQQYDVPLVARIFMREVCGT